ncbi:hypothetical protein [Hyphomicrobium sp. CS1GBMeth3]|uniref:hypothetical protein n=1 Tax=Hyphomicrobium sp. CS1GBMeth3 TaxID=1892845 RepID=UPI00093183D4|nr:hypothetical protein [Hyphomicrobium sp. CS1GBMeth3]
MRILALAIVALIGATSAAIGGLHEVPEHPMPRMPVIGWPPLLTDADGAPVSISEIEHYE